MRCGLKMFAKIVSAFEFSGCETRSSSSWGVQERDERQPVLQRPILVVRIGPLQARVGSA
jgi:hypothetical protein